MITRAHLLRMAAAGAAAVCIGAPAMAQGTIKIGESVQLGYVDQSRDTLDPETRVGGDEGTPITVRKPDSAQAAAFRNLAAAVTRRIDELGALGSLPKIS